MILDIALLAIGIIAIATGYNRGGIATLFSIIGYFGGGVAGFAAANWYTGDWKGLTSIVFLHLLGIFAGATGASLKAAIDAGAQLSFMSTT